jgi:hypothetical protein
VSLSKPFINRPVATSLLMLGLVLVGAVAFELLPVAPLPQVDFPTIQIDADLPGASAETMASSVATPLERALSDISGIASMTSASSLGTTNIAVQFDLSRNIDAEAQDVQTAINAQRTMVASLRQGRADARCGGSRSQLKVVSLCFRDQQSFFSSDRDRERHGVDLCSDLAILQIVRPCGNQLRARWWRCGHEHRPDCSNVWLATFKASAAGTASMRSTCGSQKQDGGRK